MLGDFVCVCTYWYIVCTYWYMNSCVAALCLRSPPPHPPPPPPPGKKAGDDKRLSKELEKHMKEKIGASPTNSYGTSPSFGVLSDVGVRRTLVDLICTMNASFPDYDFSGVGPDHFQKEGSVSLVRNKVRCLPLLL